MQFSTSFPRRQQNFYTDSSYSHVCCVSSHTGFGQGKLPSLVLAGGTTPVRAPQGPKYEEWPREHPTSLLHQRGVQSVEPTKS